MVDADSSWGCDNVHLWRISVFEDRVTRYTVIGGEGGLVVTPTNLIAAA